MRNILIFSLALLTLAGCSGNPYGKQVKEPFSSGSYMSNKKYFRSKGKGQSSSQNIARQKADIQAKSSLAGQVETNMKQVADQYSRENNIGEASDIGEKFESLARQVMNTTINDLRLIGEKTFQNEKGYTTFLAYEIQKKQMFKFIKKMAKANEQLNESERKAIEDILQAEIDRLEAEDGN
jgi:histone acetyltransferase (RNA polymerase elongator complex component)